MTKNEIIRELSKCSPRLIGRLFIVYHNKEANVRYTFAYEDTLSHGSTYDERKELARVLLSLYEVRRHIECIRVVYWTRNSDNDLLERYYDSCGRYVYSISDFIKFIKPIKNNHHVKTY